MVLFDGGVQVVEEIQVFTEPQPVKSLVVSPAKVNLTVPSNVSTSQLSLILWIIKSYLYEILQIDNPPSCRNKAPCLF